jgi:integrase
MTKLSQRSLSEIGKLAKGRSDFTVWDEALSGFGLRLRSGKLSWAFQYRFEGKDFRIKIGNADALDAATARAKAKELAGQVERAKIGHAVHPAQERETIREAEMPKAQAASFGSVIPDYLDARSKLRESSMEETKRYLEQHWKALHPKSPAEITRYDVAVELTRIGKERGPASANRARSSLSKFFKWAVGEGICENNPVVGTNKNENENGPRERSLTDTEIVAVWRGVPDSDYGRILKLILLTGCRREEIGGLKWSEIDLEARTITLPGERTKNHQAHVVPLTDAAFDILSGCERDGEFVFGRTKTRGFNGWSKCKIELDKVVKLDPWTVHDLRRTVRTGLSRLKVLPHVAEAVVNHLPAKLIRTYDLRTYEAEKREALDKWAQHLKIEIVMATGANVTRLHKK